MNYLVALLAFSAIMIVLTTLVTVLVEGIHKLLGTRAKDFEEMLTRLYEQSVKPNLEQAEIYATQEAQEFVRQMRENPAIAYASNRFLGKYFVKTDFDELTTRQFVEQFAQSQTGKELAQKLADGQQEAATRIVANLSYEFERYGQAASVYFRRRAAFFGILVAFGLTITLNVDAIRLYSSLARDTTLAEQVIESVDIEKLEIARIQALQAAAEPDKKTVEENYNSIWENYRAASSQLDSVSLPIGHSFYPYCNEGTTDTRCAALAARTAGQETESWLGGIVNRVITIVHVFLSTDGWVWLFRIILTTGLIGLGAPFWYKTYRFAAQFVPGRRQQDPDSTLSRNAQPQAATTTQQPPVQINVTRSASGAGSAEPVETRSVSTRSLSAVDNEQQEAPKQEETVTVQSQQAVPVTPAIGLKDGDLYSIFRNTSIAKETKKKPE